MDFQGEALNNFGVGDIGLQIGTTLNKRYQITDYVSLGNMTIMYIGCDSETKETVLIKELAPFAMVNRDLDGRNIVPKNKLCEENLKKLEKSFDNEINILIKMSDVKYGLVGSVPEYRNHFIENRTMYLVMKCYEGKDLQKRIADREDLNFRSIARNVIRIVEKVHKAGIIHRDIKLSNIFIKENGEIVLLDFGSATEIAEEQKTVRYVSKGFSPPELYDEKATTRWVDFFTLGAVFYQMLTGVRPIRYDDQNRMYIEDIGEYINLPWQLAWMIMKLLEADSTKRLKNMWVIKMLL